MLVNPIERCYHRSPDDHLDGGRQNRTEERSNNLADSAPIRPGEDLDREPLESYLRKQLPATDGLPAMELEQFPGGHSNLTYLVRFGEQEFVLRRPPFGPVAPTAHDMPREYKLLTAVHPHFPPAPRPYLLCEDSSIIGAPFYLMERRRGLVIRRDTPPEIGGDLGLRRRVSEVMIDTLAELHEIDIYQTGLDAIGKPVGFLTRQVRGWTERWQRAKTTDLAAIEEVIRWLNSRIPPEPQPATVVHNDFKLDNVMLDPDDPTRIIAVLDWEMCTVGDPLVDLGLLLCYWPQQGDPEARCESISPVTTEPGWMSRPELVARYGAVSGRDVSTIAYYEVFALFKVAVVLQQIYLRYVRGQTRDERFKDFDKRVSGLVHTALDLAKRSGIPVTAQPDLSQGAD